MEGFRYAPDLVIAFVPSYYGSHRHMHTRRFGANKPRFALIRGELTLTGVPVQSTAPVVFPNLHISKWLERISQKKSDAQEKANPLFQREMIELGEALIMAMNEESRLHGAQFLLVTRMPQLHERMVKRGVRLLNVQSALKNPAFRLPRGLGHLNEYGNGVLASTIAGFLQQEGLIPARHLMSFATQAAQAE